MGIVASPSSRGQVADMQISDSRHGALFVVEARGVHIEEWPKLRVRVSRPINPVTRFTMQMRHGDNDNGRFVLSVN